MSKFVQIQYDTNWYDSYDSQTCLNLFRNNTMWIDIIFKHVKTPNENMTKYSKIWANSTHLSDYYYKVNPWIISSKSSDQKHHGLFEQIWAFAYNVHPVGVLLRKKLLSPALDPNIGSDAPLQRAQSRVLLLSQRPFILF